MLSLNNLKIRTKLWLIACIALLSLSATMVAFICRLDTMLMNEKELKTRHLVETAHGILEYFTNSPKQGGCRKLKQRKPLCR